MAKKKWKLSVQKSTGQILDFLSYWDCKDIPDDDRIEIDPVPFKDTLEYTTYHLCASGVEVWWKSKQFGAISSTMDMLDDVINANNETNFNIIDARPLTIEGEFEFVKRGSSMRIIEIK